MKKPSKSLKPQKDIKVSVQIKAKPLSLFFYLIIWLLAMSIGLYIRFYPLRHFAPREISERATLSVINALREKVSFQIAKGNPGLSLQQQALLTQQQLDQLIHDNSSKVRKSIEDSTKTLMNLTSSSQKTPYLLESDSYYYFALTENILKTGHISEKIKGSKYFHPLMLAPIGFWEPLNFNPVIGFAVYKILTLFVPSISLMTGVSYTPLFIVAFTLMIFLWICRTFQFSLPIIFTGSVFFLLAPIYVKRSTFGWYDNDVYNVLFPLLILNLQLYGLSHLKENKKLAYSLAALTSLSIMLYTLFWQGWVFYFTVLCISQFLFIAYNHFWVKDTSRTKELFTFFSLTNGLAVILISLKFGPQEIQTLFSEGWKALNEFLNPKLTSWPDIYITVSELHKSSIGQIIKLSGGILFSILAIGGVITCIWDLFSKRSPSINFAYILLISFLTLIFPLTLGAQRFAILCFIPLSLFFCIGLQRSFIILSSLFTNLKIKIIPSLLTILIIILPIFPITHLERTMKELLDPIFNETWEKALKDIQEKTPQNSIINCWWPPGHFIKAIAKRRVTFDGATINVPQAYWLANVFLSQTEEEAIGYLRMLNNSANQATEYLQTQGLPLSRSVEVLKAITKLSPIEAKFALNPILKDPEKITHLTDLTHSTPAPSYLFLYNEFVENNLQLSFIGHWNFKKIEEINKDPELLHKVPSSRSKEYINFLWELSGGAMKYSGILSQVSQIKDTLLFPENVYINTGKMECQIASKTYGKGIPYSIFYLENNDVVEKILDHGNLNYSVVLFKKDNAYQCILLDRDLARSLLVRLFFFDGKGLKYFTPFTTAADLTKRTEIKVFQIIWPKF